jgi:hypothetical protein
VSNFSHMATLRGIVQPSDYRLAHTLLAYWRGLLDTLTINTIVAE